MSLNFPKRPNGMVSGQLTQKERTRIAEILREKGVQDLQCEVCNSKNWVVGDYIVSPYGLARTGNDSFRDAPNDPYFPSVFLICKNCGNTKYLVAAMLGLNLFDPDMLD